MLARIAVPGQVYLPGITIMPAAFQPDPAAVFASALSLWQACHKCADHDRNVNLSESYHGADQFMRELMRIANQFESWACAHVNFDELGEVWPYFMEERFGETCLAFIAPTNLADFNERDCLRLALRLRLPLFLKENLPVPVDLLAPNPVPHSAFRQFRIQTVRCSDDGDVEPFTISDDPFDQEFGKPHFALYGIPADGLAEHIADRASYQEIISLAQKLAPAIQFQIWHQP